MAKILSFLSWNVEHFNNDPARVDRIVSAIAAKNPDVFAIYEVNGAAVFQSMVSKMPDYTFTITESPGVPEILIGIRGGLTGFVTQKDTMQAGVPTLRPGALATLTKNNVNYPFLFLHLKSFPAPRDWGLRDDMFGHVASLKRTLDRVEGRPANFIALGDLNTMGLKAAYNNDSDFDGKQELAYVDKRMAAKATGMRRLTKTHEASWWNGKDNWEPSALDHVYAANHLKFKLFDGKEIEVNGWVNKSSAAQKKTWIDQFSDHSYLYGEIRS